MSTVTVADGDLIVKDPDDIKVVTFDWDDNLAASVQAALGTPAFIIAAIYPSTTDTVLTEDHASAGLGVQAGGRSVKVKLSGGTLGQRYRLTNRITTNETPAQQKDKSIEVLCENG